MQLSRKYANHEIGVRSIGNISYFLCFLSANKFVLGTKNVPNVHVKWIKSDSCESKIQEDLKVFGINYESQKQLDSAKEFDSG